MLFCKGWYRRKIDDLVKQSHALFEVLCEASEFVVGVFKVFAEYAPFGEFGLCTSRFVLEYFDSVFDKGFGFVGVVCVFHVAVDAYHLFGGGEYGFGVVDEIYFVAKVLFGGVKELVGSVGGTVVDDGQRCHIICHLSYVAYVYT